MTLQVGRRLLLGGPAIDPIAGQGGVSVGAGHVAEDLVVSTVFADDQETMLEPGQRRMVGNGRGVALHDGLRESLRLLAGLSSGMTLRLPNSREPTYVGVLGS